jgi:hypothetical protein
MIQEQELKGLRAIVEVIRNHDRPTLRQKAEQLKQTDGEGWAIGEMLERACIFLDVVEMDNDGA